MEKGFEFLEHEADIKIRVCGRTLQEIFEKSVSAVSEYVSEGKKIESKKAITAEVVGNDSESLLYNFIDEIIYLIDAENFIPSKCSVMLRGNNLKAVFYGDYASNYSSLKHIKAATYSEMSVGKKGDGWEAVFVIDV